MQFWAVVILTASTVACAVAWAIGQATVRSPENGWIVGALCFLALLLASIDGAVAVVFVIWNGPA